MTKYELTDEAITIEDGVKLHRIRAMRDFNDIRQGDLGGFIEVENNLSHDGCSWVSGGAWVSGNARVFGNAWVYGGAWGSGNARGFGDAPE